MYTKSLLKTTLATVALAGAVGANAAYVVGGVDFGNALSLSHIETATMAQTFLNGNGQDGTAYGVVSTVNGDATYCAGGATCSLYYVATFTNSQNFSPTYVEFTGATISIFYSNTVLNLLEYTSPSNIATIQAMTPWLVLQGHAGLGGGAAANAQAKGGGQLTGASLSGDSYGLFDVVGGMADVVTAMDKNSSADAVGGFADVILTASFNNEVLNDYDFADGLTTGCTDGTAASGAWCYQGTANLRGKLAAQVPEPGTLAIAGLGLGLLGLVTRRRARRTDA